MLLFTGQLHRPKHSALIDRIVLQEQCYWGIQRVIERGDCLKSKLRAALAFVSADLPIGDICLVRQVFQHLSNKEIACTLPKLQKYRHIHVTEAQPIVREGKINPDKPTGKDIRFDQTTGRGRGVELDQFPYNLDVDEVCRVAATAAGLTEPVELPRKWHEIIVTYRIKK